MYNLSIEYDASLAEIALEVWTDKAAVILAEDILSSKPTYRGAILRDSHTHDKVKCWNAKILAMSVGQGGT